MLRPTALAFLGLLFAPAALAGDCAQPYTVDNLLEDLATIEGALRTGDNGTAGSGADKMEAGLGCLNEVIPMMIVGRAYRAVGAGKIAAGNSERGMEWFRTATEMEQAFDYGIEDLPADHPVRGYYQDAKIQASGEVVLMEDMAFIAGVNHYVDGRKYSEPKARLDRPHVYQMEGDGQVMSWIVTGNGFPPDVLNAAAAIASNDEPEEDGSSGSDVQVVGGGKAPKEKKAKPGKEKPEKVAKGGSDKPTKTKTVAATTTGADGTVVVKRQRPPEKTPLLIGGTAVIAGAGGIYMAATASAAKFQKAKTVDEIETLQASTNQLVIISAATLAVGAGTLTWGAILDGGGTPVPGFNVRF